MSRSRRVVGRNQRLLFSLPLIALALAMGALYFANAPAPLTAPAEDFTFRIDIQLRLLDGNTSFVIPPPNLGVVGGRWMTHQYDSDGIGGQYPIFSLLDTGRYGGNPSIIHVRSRVVRNYALADLFALWGEPLGQSKTLNYTSNPTGSAKFGNTWVWNMCIGNPPSVAPGPPNWGSQVLTKDVGIFLIYADPNAACF